MDEAQQKLGRIHGRETSRKEGEGRQKIQGRARRTGGRRETDGENDNEEKVEKALLTEREAGGVGGDYFPVVVDNLIGIAPRKRIARVSLRA
jgi:hypothetical protein